MAEVSICSTSGSAELTPEEERIMIRDIALAAESTSKEGDSFYLITQRWWQYWIEYVNQDQQNNGNDASLLKEHSDSAGSSLLKRPSGIDNSNLIYDATPEDSNMGIEIHDTLLEGRDYVLLPQEVWNQLYMWYGGGPSLPRKVISSGLSQSEYSVEVYPLRLQLLVVPKGDSSTIRISKKETIGELHRRACENFDLTLEQVRIWDYYGHRKHALINDMDKSLDDANIQMDQDLLVEVINLGSNTALGGYSNSALENGIADKDASSDLADAVKSSVSKVTGRSYGIELVQNQNSTSSIRESDNSHAISGVSTRGSSFGLTGLLNLGNTCFMNSAIQCLVHTPEFAKYFREDYHQEINWQNPLGMVGELAMAFGDLLRKLWAPGRTSVAPRAFKAKLARFAPQFSGYNQHDSQELLAFLLDGLHEDLNRVKHKPYIKSRDADGRPDEEVADEYWANHIARNDSIIVDVCQGQYKSTLVCPMCNKVSVTFDPFMYLSLPLQFTTTRSMTVTVFTCDGSMLPSPYTVTVPKQGRCRDLIQALGSFFSLKHDEKLLLAEVENHRVKRFLEDPLTLLTTIKDDDHMVAYKIPKSANNTKYFQLIHQCEEERIVTDADSTSEWKLFGTPLLLPISCDEVVSRSHIQTMVSTLVSPLIRTQPPIDAHAESDHLSNGISEICTAKAESDLIKEDDPNSKSSTSIKIPLQLIDETGTYVDLSVGEEEAVRIPSSSCSLVIHMNWSKTLLDKYDIDCLENLPEVFKSGPVPKKARTEPLSLYTCLEAFLREEPLVPEDMWYCPKCNERRQASKKLDLWRLPEVLVIHLKRFSYSRSMKHKLETFVNFPVYDFDLTNYVANKNNSRRQLYELYALTNHYGGMGSGHYTAYIKILEENRWYNFDDSHISLIHEEEVKSAAAYVLFYRRVKTKDGVLGNASPSSAADCNPTILK